MSKQVCSICHNEYDLEEFDPKTDTYRLMEENHICFTCSHWKMNLELDHSDERNNRGIPIVVSKFYGPSAKFNAREHWFIPFMTNGRNTNCSIHPLDRFQPPYKVLMFDGRLYTVSNMWHQGSIPPVWFDKFPVNARLISTQEAASLIARKDTKVAEDLTHYIISKEGLDTIFRNSTKRSSDDV